MVAVMESIADISRDMILPGRPQRAVGKVELGFRYHASAGVTRIEQFYQEGCLRARLPRPVTADICDAVTVNISGGIAGGDELASFISVGDEASACVAGQAAERVYQALGGRAARVTTTIKVCHGARLDYLPQETIFYNGFALERSLDISLADDATYLGVESLMFGRQAMGEQIGLGMLRDRISLRRDGRLVFQDMTRLDGDLAALLGRKAMANGAVAMATILYAAPDVSVQLPLVRQILEEGAYDAGASVFDGVLLVRMLATSSAELRRGVVAVLSQCRNDSAMPRVWQN